MRRAPRVTFRAGIEWAIVNSYLHGLGAAGNKAHCSAFAMTCRNSFVRKAGAIIEVERVLFISLPLQNGHRFKFSNFVALGRQARAYAVVAGFTIPTNRTVPD